MRKVLLHYEIDSTDIEDAQWRRDAVDSSEFWLCAHLDKEGRNDGIALSRGRSTVLETPCDSIHVHFAFRKQAPQPEVEVPVYVPQPASLLYKNAANSYHNHYLKKSDAVKARASVLKDSSTDPKSPSTGRERNNNSKTSTSSSAQKSSPSSDFFGHRPKLKPVNEEHAVMNEELFMIKGVISKFTDDAQLLPPQLHLQAVWEPSKCSTDEPCSNTSVMSHPAAQKWARSTPNLSFAKKEARKGILAFQKTEGCLSCTKFTNSTKHKKVRECDVFGCKTRELAKTEVDRLVDATSDNPHKNPHSGPAGVGGKKGAVSGSNSDDCDI